MILFLPLSLVILIASFDTQAIGLFTQKRVGLKGKEFLIFKVRTMKHSELNKSTTTVSNDPRVTFLGAFLRRMKIDELPQLINVFLGSMSFVGPRPTVLDDYSRMDDEQKLRSTVKPGITGFAQVSGNTSLSWPRRLKLDVSYVRNLSLKSDILILWKTIILILKNKIHTDPAGSDEWRE